MIRFQPPLAGIESSEELKSSSKPIDLQPAFRGATSYSFLAGVVD